MIKELHEEAEKNRAFIDSIKANKQGFIDSWFLNEFKSAVDIYGKSRIEDDVKNAVKAGKTKFSRSFFLISPGKLGGVVDGTVPEMLTGYMSARISLKDFYISGDEYKYLELAGINSYAPSLNGIKAAYEYWLGMIKSLGLTVEHADDFELSEKEYKKLIRGFWGFKKSFTVNMSF